MNTSRSSFESQLSKSGEESMRARWINNMHMLDSFDYFCENGVSEKCNSNSNHGSLRLTCFCVRKMQWATSLSCLNRHLCRLSRSKCRGSKRSFKRNRSALKTWSRYGGTPKLQASFTSTRPMKNSCRHSQDGRHSLKIIHQPFLQTKKSPARWALPKFMLIAKTRLTEKCVKTTPVN